MAAKLASLAARRAAARRTVVGIETDRVAGHNEVIGEPGIDIMNLADVQVAHVESVHEGGGNRFDDTY
jgi:hypothetical protein